MPTDSLQALFSGTPIPNIPVLMGTEPKRALEMQDIFNRQFVEYVRRLLQKLSTNTIQPLILPLTTKGDLLTRDLTSLVRLGVGTNTHVLTADSAQSSGIKWAAVPSSGATVIHSSRPNVNVALSAGAFSDFSTTVTLTSGHLNTLNRIIKVVAAGNIDPGGTVTAGENSDMGINIYLGGVLMGFSGARDIPLITSDHQLQWRLEAELLVAGTGSGGSVYCSCRMTICDDSDINSVQVNGQHMYEAFGNGFGAINTTISNDLKLKCHLIINAGTMTQTFQLDLLHVYYL